MPRKARLRIIGIEVVQSLQNPRNEISLLQGRPTYFRIYLKKTGGPEIDRVDGEVELKINQNSQTRTICLESQAPLENFDNRDLLRQRLHWNQSLNFHIDEKFFEDAGFNDQSDIKITVKVKCLNCWFGQIRVGSNITNAGSKKQLNFQTPTELRCQIVGYRYTDRENIEVHSPTAGDYRAIKEFIRSAFPISNLIFNHRTIDAPRKFNRLRKISKRSDRSEERVDFIYSLLFQHLLAIRNQDLSQSISPEPCLPSAKIKRKTPAQNSNANTLYLGLISDPTGRFGGAAMNTPQYATPHIVAFAETEAEGILAAHELGHLMGRLHPGIPNKKIHGKFIGQSDQYSDPNNKCKSCVDGPTGTPSGTNGHLCTNEYGYISADQEDAERILLGLDTRASKHAPSVLHHNENFDLMTYLFPQWLSGHTYEGMLCRMREIQILPVSARTHKWVIIGGYNFVERTGIINFVLPSAINTSLGNPKDTYTEPTASNIGITIELKVEWLDCEISYIPVDFKDPKIADSNPDIGVFQETLESKMPNPPKRITLLINCIPIDVYDLTSDAPPVLGNSSNHSISKKNNLGTSDFTESITRGSFEFDDCDRIFIKYSVDNGEFYFLFNWGARPDRCGAKKVVRSSLDSITYFEELLNSIDNLSNPITTTIQFKRNKKPLAVDPIFCTNRNYKWETISTTNRIQEKLWISPEFCARLSSNGRDETLPDNEELFVEKVDIHNFDTTFNDLCFQFRVFVTVAGINYLVYDTTGDSNCVNILDKCIRIEALGSLGPQKLNFFKDIESGEHTEPRQYYRPTVYESNSSQCGDNGDNK